MREYITGRRHHKENRKKGRGGGVFSKEVKIEEGGDNVTLEGPRKS